MYIVSTCDTGIGTFNTVKHRIDMSYEKPFEQKFRRIPSTMKDKV